MGKKYIIDSLPWLVPSAAIILAASGVLNGVSLFGGDDAAQPQQATYVAPQPGPVVPMTAPLATRPQPAASSAAEVEVTRGVANDPGLSDMASLARTQAAPVALPEASSSTLASALNRAAPAPEPAPVQPRQQQAALTPPPDYSAVFAAAAPARAQCVDDLRILIDSAKVYFPSGGLTADAAGMEQARLIGLLAQSCPGVKIMVEGHSDPSGDPAANLRLSQQRAEFVVQLIGASGVPTERFVAKGFGDKEPSGVTGPQPSLFYDRRVEFSIIEEPAQAQRPIRVSANPWAGTACVAELRQAVASTTLFYAPGGISVQPQDLNTAMRLAEMAMACPGARLRVIGHYSGDMQDRETTTTGLMRAKALMAMMVGRGAAPEQIIIAAPSRARGGAADNGMPGNRVNFDVILEEG